MAYNNRGNLYDETGRQEDALRDCDKAIELAPDYAKAYLNRAVVLFNKGKNAETIRDCTRAIELERGYAKAYCYRAAACFMSGQLEDAWFDVNKCEVLGFDVPADFAEALKEARGR